MMGNLNLLFALVSLSSVATAHTIVRSVYVNGVDQGTGYGIRTPGHNGPFGPDWWGYNSSPVKNLTNIDLRCNILGDHQARDTIEVVPGDIVTFEWGHEDRLPDDGIIATSHHGPGIVYMSADPPTDDSWVKLWEEGEYEKNKWFVTTKLVEQRGAHSVQIPEDLKPGYYLLRPELVTLHEAESIFLDNPARGVQIYMACVQIKVLGSGEVELPGGVGFPGAYDYKDPGINYNVYWTPEGAAPYLIPGPTVWSGAAPAIANPSLGPKKGALTNPPWTKYMISSTYYHVATAVDGTVETLSELYTANWPSTYVPPAEPTVTTREPTSEPPVTTREPTIEPPVTTREPTVEPPVTTVMPTTTLVPTVTTTPAPTTTPKPDCKKGIKLGGQCGGKKWSPVKGKEVCKCELVCKKITDKYSECAKPRHHQLDEE